MDFAEEQIRPALPPAIIVLPELFRFSLWQNVDGRVRIIAEQHGALSELSVDLFHFSELRLNFNLASRRLPAA